MTAPFDNIVQHLFHQPSLQSVTIDELERMALQDPSFAAAQFLLLKKMQETDHPGFSNQLRKTTLYFNNPLWLQFLLQPQREKTAVVAIEDVVIFHKEEYVPQVESEKEMVAEKPEEIITAIAEQPVLEPITPIVIAEEYNYDHTIEEKSSIAGQQAEQAIHAEENNIPVAITVADDQKIEEATTVETEEPVQEAITAMAIAEEYNYNPVVEEEPSSAKQQNEEEIHATEEQNIPIAIAEQYNYNNVAEPEIPVENNTTTSPLIEEAAQSDDIITEIPQENNYSQAVEVEMPVENNTEQITILSVEEPAQHAVIADTEQEYTREDAADADNTEQPTEQITETHRYEKPLLTTITETAAAKEDMLFEPYHTIDYFASQGIKLSKIEPEPQDKLGKQLKSFTEWLKSMKKLPQVSVNKILAENEESQVVEAASHSIETKEVITETMAEVFEKQGLYEKATEVYRKLSLLNPAKSAYFASRIEALKQ
jgi:hypothetical protein